MVSKVKAVLSVVAVSTWLVGCASSSDGGNAPTSAEANLTKAVSNFECAIGKGNENHDDARKFSFQLNHFNTTKAAFVESTWKVFDEAGGEITPDSDSISLLLEGFDDGPEVKQCQEASGTTTCDDLVVFLGNPGSEIPVTITLTKKSDYKDGFVDIDNEINVGDDSGNTRAPLTCTVTTPSAT